MLRVIQGGALQPPPPPTTLLDWRNKRRKLKEIETSLSMRNRGAMGPRMERGCVVAVIALVGTLLPLTALEDLPMFRSAIHWQFIRQTIDLLPFIAGAVAFGAVQWRSSIPKTWTNQLDHQLSEYDPVNRDAFRDLQQRTQEIGYLSTKQVNEWLDLERGEIDTAAAKHTLHKSGQNGFLNKEL